MSNDMILKEISRVGVSGENTQQLSEFMQHRKIDKHVHMYSQCKTLWEVIRYFGYVNNDTNGEMYTGVHGPKARDYLSDIKLNNYEIILNDKENNYWLIRKSHVIAGEDLAGSKIIVYIHDELYLAGFNDDQKYFITRIERMPEHVYEEAIRAENVMPIVNWINKADMGFTRIQGDILYRLVPLELPSYGRILEARTLKFQLSDALTLEFDLLNSIAPPDPRNEFGRHALITVRAAAMSITEPNILDRTTILDSYQDNEDQYRLVFGTQELLMKHPEHKDQVLETKGDAILLTHQRGKRIEAPMMD